MAFKSRHRSQETRPVVVAKVTAATVVAVGDLILIDSNGLAYPASSETWNTDLATTQGLAHDKFLGVAEAASAAGETDLLRVGAMGDYEFDCASATFKVGQYVGWAKQTGNFLENQKVVGVANAGLACGQVVKAGTSLTSVLVRIRGTMTEGGVVTPTT